MKNSFRILFHKHWNWYTWLTCKINNNRIFISFCIGSELPRRKAIGIYFIKKITSIYGFKDHTSWTDFSFSTNEALIS